MRIFLGFLGGTTTLVIYFVAWFKYVTRDLPKGGSVGIAANLLIRPPFVLWEILSFAVGVNLVYVISRHRT